MSVSVTLMDVQILLLALERETERRNTILELLDSATDTDGVHILELTAGLEGGPVRRQEHARAERKISWPCSTEQPTATSGRGHDANQGRETGRRVGRSSTKGRQLKTHPLKDREA